MENPNFEAVYREQVAELFDAEQQMIEEMPRVIRAVTSAELRSALELHLAETREQAVRVKTILEEMPGAVPRVFSDAMRAFLAKARLLTVRIPRSAVLDAALIAALRELEYFEAAGYSNARQFARMLGHERAAALLGKTLKEEQDTAADLYEIAESLIMGEELEDALLEEAASV